MRVTNVEIRPEHSSEVCVLSFRDPSRKNPYNVKNIGGLDADEIVQRSYKGSGGSKLYNLSLEKRDVITRIELNPNFADGRTYSDLRDDLYKIIASSRTGKIQIRFNDEEGPIAAVSGFVSKFEAAHFTQTPEVQVTVKCDDPILRAIDPVVLDLTGLDPQNTNIQDLQSTAPHGFIFEMDLLDDASSFRITDPNDSVWSFEVAPNGGFLYEDVLYFSSDYGNKQLYIVRGSEMIHLADVIVPGSVWPILFPGDNFFSVDNPTLYSWKHISHRPSYWGV